jgi:hypothetical protein
VNRAQLQRALDRLEAQAVELAREFARIRPEEDPRADDGCERQEDEDDA